jgi:tetratricopeptide (TPR) repeat protein/2-polyprenyl-3-methyl-5-hydroxy-6-metoxy-1,4-benzoquinol methylase
MTKQKSKHSASVSTAASPNLNYFEKKQTKSIYSRHTISNKKQQLPHSKTSSSNTAIIHASYLETLSHSLTQLARNKNFESLREKTNKALLNYPDNLHFLVLHSFASSKLGFHDDAERSIEHAITLEQNSASLLNTLAIVKFARGKIKAALQASNKALRISPCDHRILFNKGKILTALHDYKSAALYFKQTLEIQPELLEPRLMLARTYYFDGNLPEALTAYMDAIDVAPDDPSAFFEISDCLRDVSFTFSFCRLKIILQKILERGWYSNPTSIVPTAISIIKSDPIFTTSLSAFREDGTLLTIEQITHLSAANPIFLKLLEIANITDIEIENFLRCTRFTLLTSLNDSQKTAQLLDFLLALSLQCFGNEYLYPETPEESDLVQCLEQKISADAINPDGPDDFDICLLACYRPLSSFEWAASLLLSQKLTKLLQIHVTDPCLESKLKNNFATLKEPTNLVSQKMKEQYENYPYPRWTGSKLRPATTKLVDFARASNLKVDLERLNESEDTTTLIAGCGTGRQIFNNLASYNSSKILALDLSISSLAYAKRKTDEISIKNVEFIQGDILDLGEVEESFDAVECMGVLHHMANPIHGWKILVDRMKVGGLIKIGLYSHSARQDISKIRSEIKNIGLTGTNQHMKLFRNHLINSDEPHHQRISKTLDFFSTSNLRDLLFNEHEKHFTIPEIQENLSDLRLGFCGMYNWRSLIKDECVLPKNKTDLFDLCWWNDFEIKNPNAFFGMYQFYCQRLF